MKRTLLTMMLVGILAALAITSVVSAQNPTPPAPGQGWGRGGMMGSPMMGQGGMVAGSMHDYMFPLLAEKLGLTVDELTDLYAKGETFWTAAESQGFTVEQAQQMMTDARSEALDRMVADGVITQEQADWMKDHMGQGRGGCGGGRGPGRGGMGGWRAAQDA